jgi:hypothetical protein
MRKHGPGDASDRWQGRTLSRAHYGPDLLWPAVDRRPKFPGTIL